MGLCCFGLKPGYLKSLGEEFGISGKGVKPVLGNLEREYRKKDPGGPISTESRVVRWVMALPEYLKRFSAFGWVDKSFESETLRGCLVERVFRVGSHCPLAWDDGQVLLKKTVGDCLKLGGSRAGRDHRSG